MVATTQPQNQFWWIPGVWITQPVIPTAPTTNVNTNKWVVWNIMSPIKWATGNIPGTTIPAPVAPKNTKVVPPATVTPTIPTVTKPTTPVVTKPTVQKPTVQTPTTQTPTTPIPDNGAEFGANTKVAQTPEVNTQPQLPPVSTAPSYTDDSMTRQNQVISNLNNFLTTNPGMFADYNSFQKNFQYDQRDATQKQRLDNFYQTNQSTIQKAQENLATMNTLNNLTGSSLAAITDDQATLLMNNNPTKYQEYLKAKQDATNLATINWDTSGVIIQPDAFKTQMEEMLKKMGVNLNDLGNWVAYYDDPKYTSEVQPALDDYSAALTEKNRYELQITSALANAKQELEWTGWTRAQVDALANKTKEELAVPYQEALIKAQTAATMYQAKAWLFQDYITNQKANQDRVLNLFQLAENIQTQSTAAAQNQAKIEQGKYTVSANPMGTGWMITNTKTAEHFVVDATTAQSYVNAWATNNTNGWLTTTTGWTNRRTYTDKLGITQDKWNSATDAEKQAMIQKMYAQEWGDKWPTALVNRINDPAALERPGNKTIQDYLTSMWGTKYTNPSNGISYVQFPTMEQWLAATQWYIDKFGLTVGWTTTGGTNNISVGWASSNGLTMPYSQITALEAYRNNPSTANLQALARAGMDVSPAGIDKAYQIYDSMGTYEKLPPADKQVVDSYGKWDIKMPTRVWASDKQLNLIAAVEEKYGDVSGLYDQKISWKSNATGTVWSNLTAFNTAIEHLWNLYNNFTSLNNVQIPLFNEAGNFVWTQVAGSGNAKTFTATANILAWELAKAAMGNWVVTEWELNSIKNTITPNMTKDQFNNVMKSYVTLMAGKMTALQENFQASYPGATLPRNVLTPWSATILKKIGVVVPWISGSTQSTSTDRRTYLNK